MSCTDQRVLRKYWVQLHTFCRCWRRGNVILFALGSSPAAGQQCSLHQPSTQSWGHRSSSCSRADRVETAPSVRPWECQHWTMDWHSAPQCYCCASDWNTPASTRMGHLPGWVELERGGTEFVQWLSQAHPQLELKKQQGNSPPDELLPRIQHWAA